MKNNKLELEKINKEINEKINKYENELNELNKVIERLKNIIKEKEKIINEEKNYINKIKTELLNNSLSKNKELIEEIKIKENKINEIKSTISIEIKSNEKIISVIFNSFDEDICHSIICKNTDNFKKIEKKFYEKYPEYRNTKNYFVLNGKEIDKTKNLDENKIKNSDIITLNSIK